ncbi:O-acetylserine/cysteine efflux transporter [Mesorhizobium qingshengii]|uniref:O-acetylserine/cysteine efflux transporter n=2 Tax=Mesorhizobium qingshengii TaxID=1165689 RepID=A0A1G5X9D1_9HYPH|nr:O-acetylserine/cysteine efflux transporter [Mesorhizobium qingshengii]
MLLALLVAAIWGINFTVISIGLGSFPPLLLAALRFVVASLPALVLPRPNVSWPRLFWIGATLFLGQFALLFTGMALGLPAGLASVTLQSQAFLTILIASIVLRERPTARQVAGSLIAFVGLGVIGLTVGGDFSTAGLGLCLASALCWAFGNVLLRGAGKVDMLAMVVWLSLIPPVPLFALSMLLDGPATIAHALTAMRWSGAGAVIYISVLSTILSYAIWGHLLKLYPAGTVAPFSLLVPIFGALSARIVLGEQFEVTRVVGMMLILAGLVVVVAPLRQTMLVQKHA